ncbi:MAG: helix-turn-helix transcriptional regulator [Lachnospiraceae bacterium]|jgi:transcriptional regulator with XRE-family HTH domain|nr:helix-turn-helix transcriptional regulator [Lachnospiraceae bacterium]
MKPLKNTLGGRLAKLRHDRKLTQQQVADELHIARTTYASYEQDMRNPDCSMLKALAAFFNVTIDYLVTGDVRH